ncbi:hypothetical protein EX30DRAFT_107441 [Ascodesmis nigricans]|uniref:Xylanolytic transcriptional activator regulatory domain-containing protein n=1 Tax=Ascodesmis nigricans TaxID=341454 RepID=A0A4S2MQC5_9PEZI|nr:hypothetical protein EX30DRAFT_107441 [Ascodesmis nigricans]
MNHQHQFSSHLFANTPTKDSSSSHFLDEGSRSSLSPAAESVTDSTRTALATTFVQNSGYGVGAHGHQRRASLSAQAMNPNFSKQASINLPLTKDLQRYVDAYIKYFHPHLPFLHLPTLRFDPSSGYNGQGSHGREYLVLSMAAVGALYEYEQQAAGELFEAAKKLVDIFIEERRKAAISARSMNGSDYVHCEGETQIWLVQAMLLNCIFGLQCGDHLACDIARNQISTLVQLARSAGLTRPTSMPTGDSYSHHTDQDIHMSDMELSPFGGSLGSDGWSGLGIKVDADEQVAWLNWVNAEERKRTLYGVHYISSLLVAAHNQDPRLGNNEIQLDLPCNENFWMAETAPSWSEKGGMMAAAQSSPSFSLALSGLLSAGQQQYGLNSSFHHYSGGQQGSGIPPYPPSGIIPSTFGCLILICALHVYIWEKRQNHNGRHLSADEVQAMQAHIEPGLKAWQSAWYLTPHHSIERPNPFGMGPLSADSIPLLDLAYIRLYVDLGRAKEFFWARDFEGMAEELARGWAQSNLHITPPSSASSVSGRSESSFSNAISPASSPGSGSPSPNLRPIKLELTPTPRYASLHAMQPSPNHLIGNSISPREHNLRQAAFCAADSLAMSDTLSATKTTTFSSCQSVFRELPIQSALCTFECAQVLAEWIATVQDRIAPFMGIMTLDQCNLDTLEALMTLEAEDRKLLGKVRDMLKTAETKMVLEQPRTDYPIVFSSGLGATVLRVAAYMLEQAIVWPATRLMSEALRAQAEHMDLRTRRAVPHLV